MTSPAGGRSKLQHARAATSVFLAITGCLLCVVSVVAIWGRNQVLDTDRYMASVTPLASDPTIQDEVATKVANAISSRLGAAALAGAVLPERAAFLAAPLGDAVDDMVEEVTHDFVASPAFVTLWTELNLTGHRELVSILNGTDTDNVLVRGGRLTLDLSSVVEAVRDRLEGVGLSVVTRLPPISLVIDLGAAEGIEGARDAVALLDKVANVLPVVSLGLIAASVVAARRRRRSIALVSAGLAVAMTTFEMFLGWSPSIVADHVPRSAASPDAVRAYYGHLTALLHQGAVTTALVAIGVWLVASLGGTVNAWASVGSRSRVGLAASEARFYVPVVAVATLLLWRSPDPWTVVLVIVAATAVYVALRRISAGAESAPVVAPAP